MTEIRCQSPFCIVKDQVRGRMFEPSEDAQGLNKVWCPTCIKLGTQINFYAHETAEMIRRVYNSYAETKLPKEVKLFLEAYTNEIMQQLGEEL